MKLSVKLILVFALLALLPMMLIGYVAYENGRQSILKDRFQHLTSVNTLRAAEFSRWIDNNKQSLRELARRPSIREYAAVLSLQYKTDPEYKVTQRLILDDHFSPVLEEEGGFLDLFILRIDDGKVLVSTYEEQEGQHKENRPYFIAGKDRTYVQNVYYCLALEEPVIVISTPVNDNEGNPIAVLAGRVDLGEMTRIMLVGNSPDSGEESYLVNRFNFFITEPMFGEEYILRKAIHTEGVEAGLAYDSGVRLYDDYRGVPVIGAYQWMPEFETVIITEIDQAKAFASIIRARNQVFGIAVAVGLLVVLIGFVFARSIIRRLRYLVEGSAVIGRGNLGYRLDAKGKDEIDDLANALNSMAGSLGEVTASRDELNREIATRRQAEERIRREQEFIASLLEGLAEGFAVINSEGKQILVNDKLCKMTGYSKEELLGTTPPFSYWAEEGLEDINKAFEDTLEGADSEYELIFKMKTGERFNALISPRKLTNPDGNTIFIATVKDITERKRDEELIRTQAEVTKNMTEGVYIVGRHDVIIRWTNSKFEEMFGYEPEEMIGKHASIVNAPADSTPMERADEIMEVIHRTGEWQGEVNNIKKDGTPFWCYASVSVFTHSEYGEVLLAVHADITERKQLEEERQKAAKLESVSILAGGIAHDFNNLLTGIMGNIGLAMRHIKPKSTAMDRLAEAEKASYRARDLTQQLLTFARGGAPIKKLVSIKELIENATLFALRGSNVKPEFSLPDDLWAMEIDEGQINQAITNIIINADEAMPEGGILHIGVKNTVIKRRGAVPLPGGNYVEITIQDNGIGIPKDILDKIFDPYFTTKQKGSGLGLTTTYSIIDKHAGHITVESTPTVGTTFYIYLPASKEQVPVKEEAVAETAIAGKGRVLVMDDEEIIRELLYLELTEVGYEVEVTEDGAEAIEQYTKAKESGRPFDVVILDLTVPGGMGGKDVIKKLLEIDPNVKAIVSSGYATDPIMAGFKEYGFSGVVAKPYSVAQLEKTLQSLLRERK